MAEELYEYRVLERKLVAGVCAGVADRQGMKATTVRFLYVFGQFLTLPMIVVYLFQWFVHPVKRLDTEATKSKSR